MHSCLDRHKGQIVGYIHSVAVLAARNQVLEQAVARKPFRRSRIPAFIQII